LPGHCALLLSTKSVKWNLSFQISPRARNQMFANRIMFFKCSMDLK